MSCSRTCHTPTCHTHTHTGETAPGDFVQCLERAEMVREGTDVTILCYSRMRYTVMQAVTELEKQGYNPEVYSVWYTVCGGLF